MATLFGRISFESWTNSFSCATCWRQAWTTKNDIQMREWVNAYEIPIFTVVTKMDYVPKNKILNVLKSVEKQFGGVVLPFSAIDRRYCDDILHTFWNWAKKI